MNSKIKEIVSLLLESEGLSSMKEAQQVSNYFSVLYTLCLKNTEADTYENLLMGFSNVEIFRKDFSSMVSDFFEVSSRLSEYTQRELLLWTKEIALDTGENDMSWAYEYIKSSLATFVQKKRDKGNKCKIYGEELLLTTQFFTDDYMVKYIVDSVFEFVNDSIPNTVFVDPACGGGNFLTYVSKKLFAWYKDNTSLNEEQIVERIFGEQIVGYDLDCNIAEIAKLSLILQRDKFCNNIGAVPFIKGGKESDKLGFLTNDIKENTVKKELDFRRNKGKRIAIVTNPPFMGGRDLDPEVKSYLDTKLPLGMGDLCASFMYKMMAELKDGDILGSVLQNSWLFLSSYKDLRREFLENYELIKCADLGAHAFADISGEKANVVLSLIKRKSEKRIVTQFINLRSKGYYTKRDSLLTGCFDITELDCQLFLDVPDYAFNYELVEVFRTKPKNTYGDYAHIMQGTSTGDSKNDVKFFWEVSKDNTDWKLVSKGGGFCKWCGLNYYKVLWGEGGDALRKNKGCALRNISEIPDTQLVYSDTGTMGLNVRKKRNDQVFIASGPGIHALIGYPECHQAFLNSKFATYWLKISNPKLTVSAGYIAKIPVTKSLLLSTKLKSLAEQCISSKGQLLDGKLPNAECRLQDYSKVNDTEKYIIEVMLSDFNNYYKILKAEEEINRIVYKSLHLSNRVIKAIEDFSGEIESRCDLTVEIVDSVLCELIDDNCQVIGTKRKGVEIGSDNLIILACSKLGCSPEELCTYFRQNISRMNNLRQKYYKDFTHKVFLKAHGVSDLLEAKSGRIVPDIKHKMLQICPALGTISDSEIEEISRFHKKAFFNTPLLSI